MEKPIAIGRVDWLGVNGGSVQHLNFRCGGPSGDMHSGTTRILSGHDRQYIRTSELEKGDKVFNWRSWTALAAEEITEIEKTLGVDVPRGCLLENIVISGIQTFSQLPPTTRLVFPKRMAWEVHPTQAILAVWQENGPCRTVGERLEKHHRKPGLKTEFIAAAQGKRGVMGFVLSIGEVKVGDEVLVFPPTK